jgi:hypothetical protein
MPLIGVSEILSVLSLSAAWHFIEPVCQEFIKAKLKKPRKPESVLLAQNLYAWTLWAEKSSQELAEGMRQYALDAQAGVPSELRAPNVGELSRRARNALMHAHRIRDCILQLNPGLAIHEPQLSEQFRQYIGTRELLFARIPSMSAAEASQLAELAASNAERIQSASRDLATFLKGQFSFKELSSLASKTWGLGVKR